MTRILRIHYFYNKVIENKNNFRKDVTKIESILNLWRLRNLTLEGIITVFKTLALSKIIHLSLDKTIPNATFDQLSKMQKDFISNKT